MAQLLVIPDIALREIQTAIVNAAHMASDTNGERLVLQTIDSTRLAVAARLALEIATGEVVWPASQRLTIRAPKQRAGVFDIEER